MLTCVNRLHANAYRHLVTHFDFLRIKPRLEEYEAAVSDSMSKHPTQPSPMLVNDYHHKASKIGSQLVT
eukprot:COSAG01_NODE_8717_length_2687_cov_1.817233_4_plen_69_part_00